MVLQEVFCEGAKLRHPLTREHIAVTTRMKVESLSIKPQPHSQVFYLK